MASINLHAEASASVTCVSNNFIDNYMKGLSGDDVKVYLRLLRCIYDAETDFSIASTADCLGISARNVRTSLDSLSAAGILSLDYDEEGELCDICMRPLSAQMTEEGDGQMSFSFTSDTASSDVQKETSSYEPVSTAAPAEVQKSVEESAPAAETATDDVLLPPDGYRSMSDEELENDPEIKQILFIAERYLGTALNSSAMSTILYWHIDLGMNEDMIDYLITSTLDAGKRSGNNIVHYMNSIAISWYKNGIRTVKEAMDDKKQHSENVYAVKTAFGTSGNLTPAQLEYVDRWFNEWHFSKEMVTEACNRTMTNIGQPKYGYAEKILKSWREKHYTELSQVADDDEQHSKDTKARFAAAGKSSAAPKKNSFNSYSEKNNYDSKALEAMLLKNNTF